MYSQSEIAKIKHAAYITAVALERVKKEIKKNVSLLYLDKIAQATIIENNCIPSFLGYQGFSGSICTSVNDEVIHGIPSNYRLKDNDLISIDLGAQYKGFTGDAAFTVCVGDKPNVDQQRLLEGTEQALLIAVKELKAGMTTGDIGNVIQKVAKQYNLSIVQEFSGHGVGKNLHEEPYILNYGKKGKGDKFYNNQIVAIEPMFLLGKNDIYIAKDNWTVKSVDRSLSAHFEHTIIINDKKSEILSKI